MYTNFNSSIDEQQSETNGIIFDNGITSCSPTKYSLLDEASDINVLNF